MAPSRFAFPASAFSGPRALVWLMAALVPAFVVTATVTRAYRAEHRRLAADWFARGETALAENRPEEAIEALRVALTFSREDRTFRLRLAQALMEAGRAAEARAYLLTLRDAQPGSGPVNLELGRLAARDGNLADAIRFYHGAIEGAWREAAETERRRARLELIEFLVRQGAETQAQAELLALHGDLPPDRETRTRVARLLFAAGLRERGLSLYEDLARAHPRDPDILAAAGLAMFDAGRYAPAAQYLARAVAAGAASADVISARETARLIPTLDPFARRLSSRERLARARRGLDAALARIARCPEDTRGQYENLEAEARALMPPRPRDLSPDADLVETMADLAFRIAQSTREVCGELLAVERAILLLGEARQRGAP